MTQSLTGVIVIMRYSIINHLEEQIPISPVQTMIGFQFYPLKWAAAKYLMFLGQDQIGGFNVEGLGFDKDAFPDYMISFSPYFLENFLYMVEISWFIFMLG